MTLFSLLSRTRVSMQTGGMALANTIDDVIGILDEIIADCRSRGDRLGYFAALYRQVTLKVKYETTTAYLR